MSRSAGEYDERLATMMSSMDAHIKADALAFADLIGEVKQINLDVKALLNAKVFARAVWWTLTIVGGCTATALTLYFLYRGH